MDQVAVEAPDFNSRVITQGAKLSSGRKRSMMHKIVMIAVGMTISPFVGSYMDQVSDKPASPDKIAMPMATELRLPSLYAADQLIVRLHGLEAAAIAAPGAAIDANGLIGRNRKYGKMVSPRLQLGAGAALRVGIHADLDMAVNGFRAIEAAAEAIAADGEVVSVKPPDAPADAELSVADKASGGAFFLADACPAMIALRSSPDADAIAGAARQAKVVAALDRGVRWLMNHSKDLEAVDRPAPNRLLYNALAYHSCGVLAANAEAQKLATRFVGLALSYGRGDGVFVEKSGSDTTYQAVSVRLALDLLLSGYAGSDVQQLKMAWLAGAAWLGNRIAPDGRIDSTGNSRTCKGGESFLGAEKKVWPPGVYGALIYPAELVPSPELKSAAARLSAWARANPKADPCFSE